MSIENGHEHPADLAALVRSRTWRRNIPLLFGLFGTYLLFMPTVRLAAATGMIAPAGSLPYAGYGLLTLAAGLFLAARFYRISVVAQPDKNWARALFLLSDLIIWLVSGIGLGLLLMAVIHLVFWAF